MNIYTTIIHVLVCLLIYIGGIAVLQHIVLKTKFYKE